MTSQQIREQADRVRAIPLPAVLRLTGAQRDRHDKAKWHTAQGVLSISGMKFMNWNQGTGGGGAIDLVMHLNHLVWSMLEKQEQKKCSPLRRSWV